MARFILATLVLTLFAVLPAAAQTSRGVVAVVPAVNASGEKWEELKLKQCGVVNDWLLKHLPAAGYTVADDMAVADAVRTLGADLNDAQTHMADDLADVGRKCGAEFVVFCSVVFTEQKEQRRMWFKDKEGRTDVRVWLVDAKAGKSVIGGKTFVGRSGGNRLSLDNKGSDRQIQAAANAVRDALKEFVAPYRAR
ncbi:MAG: hypothetical protein FJX72_13165 [Armatimonadetes bacterium]|nr:hypothetical protein [Armatimonadota bacterium]